MNSRVLTAVVGIVTLGLGIAALLYPDWVMGLLGFGTGKSASAAAVLGEVRATYGGVFIVIGIFTLLAVLDPSANRSRLTFIGCIWLGSCGGRLFGTSIDGTPGLFGWLSAAVEFLLGAMLLAAAWLPKRDASSPSAAYVPPPAYIPPTTTPTATTPGTQSPTPPPSA
ncbi:MAG TPA: DUF4345 domain-containing protein [Candidatus Acidoferrales bacterium]|nr:DUF4345 domain-containing protein [Candidatus Acidoferrales bacterium]